MHGRTIACSALIALLFAAAVPAQTSQPQTTQPSAAAAQPGIPALELYHVHFAKAAPGKMNELIDAYKQAPVPAGEPGPPLILRHLQGDDWDLLVLSPLGKEETLTPAASAEEQASIQRMRGLRTQHGDTFTSGPAWADVRAALLGGAAPAVTSASMAGTTGAGTAAAGTAGAGRAAAAGANLPEGTVYTVTTYRSLPGHRDQLADTLRRVAAVFPDRRTILQHVEGASWEFVLLQRFDSWSA
ncbi:MAG: hypothetical protein EHM24_29345, partial [Acidobacteria bacterium]